MTVKHRRVEAVIYARFKHCPYHRLAYRAAGKRIFGIPGHIEVTSAKSKTRQRRLVEICPALKQWLAPDRTREGKVAPQTSSGYTQSFSALRNSLRIPSRKNGLRHDFVTCHFALHSDENLTAALAGNSPTMIHAHYKGLATKAEAEKWFNVRPAKAGAMIIPLPLQAGA